MIKVEPARLARLLATLQQPLATANANLASAKSASSATASKSQMLRSRLKLRIGKLDFNASSFEEDASQILMQEILRAEFGDEVLEHPSFPVVVDKVVEAMRGNERTAASISKILQGFAGGKS